MTPEELVTSVSPLFAALGPAFYFTPETLARGKQLGLDGFRFYFLGRGGVLGDVEWPVVMSAFGYFKPSMLERMWTTAKERYPVADATRLYLECCRDHGRAHFGDIVGLGEFCEAAEAVVAAALVDPAALTLFAGWGAQPRPDDLPGRAMQLVTTMRELRGSAHLVAVTASGLPTPVAHRIRRPESLEGFGWGPDDIPVPTDEDRARLVDADALTDRLVIPAFSVLYDADAAALVAGIEAIKATA
jgi:helix-turn-helix protein